MSRVHVIGMGRSGIATVEWLIRHGHDVVASDDLPEERFGKKVLEWQKAGVRLSFGGHQIALAEFADLVVVSPGVALFHPAVVVRREAGVRIISEIELAWCNSRGTLAAITGSNGKSTSTALVGRIFEATGQPAFACGNLGRPFIEIVDATTENSLIALEVSSYQLETTLTMRPKSAAILNLTPDHLARHGTMAGYGAAKARITINQSPDDAVVYPGDDPVVTELIVNCRARRLPYWMNLPSDAKAPGAWFDGRQLNFAPEPGIHHRFPRSSLPLPGDHNIANALVAGLMAMACGVEWGAVEAGFREFRGLPHRLEVIREREGVVWINDSKATNLDAGMTALRATPSPVILIAGGRSKGGGFRVARDLIKAKVRQLILIGEAASEIMSDWGDLVPVIRAGSLDEAVSIAGKLASEGDTVLLAPFCASFDMFRDFEERGEVFRRLVVEL
ncbi:MAG: UDP-N-acetylmuramoyl-L-alanine--D-glutamate ligase [Calditrichaeota bacterium]|nr:UDP-N-acetylmuramoyl-L-alanine--D-glutamate ligase [Calditrichota bacterium]